MFFAGPEFVPLATEVDGHQVVSGEWCLSLPLLLCSSKRYEPSIPRANFVHWSTDLISSLLLASRTGGSLTTIFVTANFESLTKSKSYNRWLVREDRAVDVVIQNRNLPSGP